MMDNRRTFPRYQVSLSLEIYTGDDVVYANAQNLSVGGLGVAARTTLPEQGQIGISMFLVEDGIEDETTAPLNLKGQIVWCTPSDAGGFLAGVRFEALSALQHQAIEHYLSRLNG